MAIGNIGAAIATIGADTRGFTSGLNAAQKKMQSFSATLSIAGFRLSAAWAATFGAIGGLTLKVGVDFETAFAGRDHHRS